MSPRRFLPAAVAVLLGLAALPASATTAAAQPVIAASDPGGALAVIATVEILGGEILAVGAGPDSGDAIYAVEGNNFNGNLYRINSSTFTIDDSVPVGAYPVGIAVTADDTVFVVNADSDDMSVVSGTTMSVFSTVPMPNFRLEPQAVALSRLTDDTVFVTLKTTPGAGPTVQTYNARTLAPQYEQGPLAFSPNKYGLAMSRSDDMYIASYGSNTVYRYLRGNTTSTPTSSASITRPLGVAISDDDTVYVTSETQNTLSAYPASNPSAITTVAVGSFPQAVVVGADNRVYVANKNSRTVSAVDPVTMTEDDTVAVGNSPTDIARTGDGLIVVGNRFGNSASVIASVSPTLNGSSGRAGSTATISLGGLPTGVVVDDSTVDSISFDGVAVTGWARDVGTNSWSGPVPAGTGSVPVSVWLMGGNSADVGTFTYTVDPPPVIPAGPPTDVSGSAGDRSALLTWAAPTSTGSFPITNYQVMSSPSGGMCVTTRLACEVTGLRNEVDYTFTVRALTGAGWSSWSSPSNVVTPQRPITPSILITGSRGEVRGKAGVLVSGTSTGLGMGAILAPWVRVDDAARFTEGSARILVDTAGDFTWQRRGQATLHIQMRTPDGELSSNILTIPRR